MSKPRLLDLMCGAGGAGEGYRRAGFEVVGVDIVDQPNYPFECWKADALDVLDRLVCGESFGFGEDQWYLGHFDAIHASPPCPAYANISRQQGTADRHPRLIEPVRERLKASGLPYVIENVPGAPLDEPVTLCGSSFGLRVRRHRLFECSFDLMVPPCVHGWQRSNSNRLRSGYEPPADSVVPVYGGGQAGFDVATCREAMGIPWMTTDELNDAIPPAYAEFIGNALMAVVTASRAAA